MSIKPYNDLWIDWKYILKIGNLKTVMVTVVVGKISQHQFKTAQLVADHPPVNM